MWTAQTTENGLAARLVAPIAQVAEKAKALLGSLADTTGLQILRKAGGKLTTPLGKLIDIPKSQIQVSDDATKWLLTHADDMKTLLNPKSSLEEQAVMAINIRNDFVAAARNSIYDTRVTQRLNEKSALWIREEIFAQYNHLSGGAKYKKIIEDAFSVKDFNVNGKEYRGLGRETEFKGACFVAGTLVHTDKGLVPIEQLKVGDMVLSKHEDGEGEQAYKRVLSTFKSAEKKGVIPIKYSTYIYNLDDDIEPKKMSIVFLTKNHPVWVERIGKNAAYHFARDHDLDFVDPNMQLGWTLAEDLIGGMVITLANGDAGEIISPYSQLWETPIDGLYWEGIFDSDPWYLVDFRETPRKVYYIHRDVNGDCNASGAMYNTIASNTPENFPVVKEFVDSYDGNEGPELLDNMPAELVVYNIEVEDFHTYYVDYFGLWVHNTEECFNQVNTPWTGENIVTDVTVDKNKNGLKKGEPKYKGADKTEINDIAQSKRRMG